MVTADDAATIAKVSSRTIYRRVEAGETHYTETAEGRLLVCTNSIRE
jgi:predicted site-specific integrase-resolvase